ncbi:MAG TPA: winged helix-turn-helix domain-containing protein [Usitatibacter sp.]|nr:winged helix-turn-helix domain-containing protein [Usitatibacter sp.]
MEKELIPQAMFLGDPEPEAVERPVLPRGASAALTQVELRLLRTLASQPGRIFTRAELLGALYLDHRVVCERTVDCHVKNLRRKLRAGHVKCVVRTTYGRGYSFAA